MHPGRPLSCAILLGIALSGCSTDPGLPVFQAVLGETVHDEQLLSTLCKRPVPAADANSVRTTVQSKPPANPGEISFSNFSSSRSIIGKDGMGRVALLYLPTKGAPCSGEMTFAFHQEASARKVGKRGMAYTSEVDLSNVVVTAK